MTAWVAGVSRGASGWRADVVRPMCQARLAVTSDYQSREPAPSPLVQPYPKDGLAISGGQHVDPIEVLARDDAARVESARSSRPRSIRQRTWRSMHSPTGNIRFAATNVASARCRLKQCTERRWTSRVDGLLRRSCNGVHAGARRRRLRTGHLRQRMDPDRAGREAHAKLGARVTYCDRRGVTYMLPLGSSRCAATRIGRTNFQVTGRRAT